jgi:hypothetical protein
MLYGAIYLIRDSDDICLNQDSQDFRIKGFHLTAPVVHFRPVVVVPTGHPNGRIRLNYDPQKNKMLVGEDTDQGGKSYLLLTINSLLSSFINYPMLRYKNLFYLYIIRSLYY